MLGFQLLVAPPTLRQTDFHQLQIVYQTSPQIKKTYRIAISSHGGVSNCFDQVEIRCWLVYIEVVVAVGINWGENSINKGII